ncbi:MAG: CpaF family protein [Actinobacteria bacterium]|nr:CpaF family protein [Actinomycetota bacterium]
MVGRCPTRRVSSVRLDSVSFLRTAWKGEGLSVSLYKRLHDIQAAPTTAAERTDTTLNDLRRSIHEELIVELGPILYDKSLKPDDAKRKVNDAVQAALSRRKTPLSVADRNQLIQDLANDILGYGPLEQFLEGDEITDILVNGPNSIYVERNGKLEKTDVKFVDETHLRRIVDKIVGEIGRRIDESTPICDARLPDGSRVNAIIHPLAIGGPFVTIRKFSKERIGIDELIRFETLNATTARFLQACTVGRLNIVVSGGSGTGKTTTLNVMSSFIPSDERIITVEDAKELQLLQEHVLTMEARPANVDGKGEVTIRDLVKNTLRMRPDRIVVGECRSGEALDMLQAMNTGHDGSLTTVHANSPVDTMARLEVLVLMAGFDLPIKAIRDQLAAALDLVVHMTRLRDGSRRITQITEVTGMEGDIISLQDIFSFDYGMGFDEATGRHRGRLKATGTRPRFCEKLNDLGIRLPTNMFDAEDFAGQPALTAGEDPYRGDQPVAMTGGYPEGYEPPPEGYESPAS